MIRIIAVSLTLLALSTASAAAQWQSSVRTAMYRDTDGLRDAGYEMIDFQTGTLEEDYGTDLYVTLYSGVSYQFVGECDRNCTDLDLGLYDADGNSIDSNYAADDTPVVTVIPRWTGRFRLHISMASCDANICGYGIGLFRR
jgi:hypothetical protein